MKGGISMPIDPTRPCFRSRVRKTVTSERIWAWQFFLSMTTFIALIIVDLRTLALGGMSAPLTILVWMGLVINAVGITVAIYFRLLIRALKGERK